MKILFNKKVAAYIFGGLVILIFATLVFIYSQLRDLDNVKNFVVEKIEKITGREVSISKAELGFEKGISIRLKQLSVYSLDGRSQEFSAKNAWCVVKLWPLLKKKIEVKKFILDSASIELVRDERGKFNLGNPLSLLTGQRSSRLFKVLGVGLMHRLSILDGKVRFRDYYDIPGSEPFLTKITNIDLIINKRFFRDAFSLVLNGKIQNGHQATEIRFSGGVDSFENLKTGQPIPLKGKVEVNHFRLEQLRPYLKNILSADSDNTKISLETDISGSLGGGLRAKGSLKYSKDVVRIERLTKRSDSASKGEIDYNFKLDKNLIEIRNLKIHSPQGNISSKGKVVGYKTENPEFSLEAQVDDFNIEESYQKFPFIFFPEASRKKFQEFLVRSSLPPLKKVSGFLEYKNGDGFIELMRADFEGFPLTNIKGTVKNIMEKPLADLSMESEHDLGQLSPFLKKSISGQSFENILDDYQKVEGKGLIEAKLQGSLSEIEKTSITAVLSTTNVSFYDAYLQSQVRNFNGQVHFNHYPIEEQKKDKSPVPIIEGKNLSGKFGKSEFYNMRGKILRQGEKVIKKIEAVYRLNAAELPKIIEGIDFSGPEFSLLKQAEFEKGDAEVNYRSFMDFDKPEEQKSWGEIKLKNIYIKHPSGIQPIAELVGEISFGDGRIDINKTEGWYGGSPISLEGQLIPKSGSLVDFDVHVNLTDWNKGNLKGIPYFENFRFSGLFNSEINLSGNHHSFKFKNKLDLTKVGYEFKEVISKEKNISNVVEMEGTYSKKEGISIGQFKFTLVNDSVTGEAKIKNLSEPEYLIKLDGVGFRANTMARFFDFFKNNTGGEIDFNISGQGNLEQFEDSLFQGSATLRDLVFEWEDRKNPLTLSADVRFSEKTYDLRFGQMESGQSKISFRGRYKDLEKPYLVLKLTGESLIVDELISNKKDEDKDEVNLKDLFETSDLLSNGESKVTVDLNQLNYKWLTLRDVSGTFLLKNKEIIFDRFYIGPKNLIKGQGKFSVKDPESIRFETRMKADEIQAKDFLAMFGDHFREGLTGKFKKLKLILKSRGRKFSENVRTLNGKLSFDLVNGVIDTNKLHDGVFSLFDLERPLEMKNKEEKDQEPSEYESIWGDFVYNGGVAETKNFVYETSQRKSAIVGKFDLNELDMDTVVGVAHLPGLDKLLNQIPLVGSILTAGDEGSLIKAYYDVEGPFDNPEITVIPFTSVSKKFLGIFQGILQSSEEILSLPEKIGVGEIID